MIIACVLWAADQKFILYRNIKFGTQLPLVTVMDTLLEARSSDLFFLFQFKGYA